MYKIPYQFLLNELYPLKTTIKKRLGGYFIYVDERLILFLRDGESQPEFNGVFVATTPEYFQEMKHELHASKMTFDLDGSTDSWIFISEDLPNFEPIVSKACTLIKANDHRLGRTD